MTISNPGALVGATFVAVAAASLIWQMIAHWAEAAARSVRGD